MRYSIDRDELWEFVTRQAGLVERLPAEATQAAADGYGDGLDEAERDAVWLAAGIATFIGQGNRGGAGAVHRHGRRARSRIARGDETR
jgi:hypothetical protein